MERQVKAGKPFFVLDERHAHALPHARAAEHRDKPGLTAATEYADGMIEHDADGRHAAQEASTTLGIADDTIVLYTTDNGPHMNSWPTPA
jgi:arylsulfatase